MQVVAAHPQRWIYIAFIIQNAFLINQATNKGLRSLKFESPSVFFPQYSSIAFASPFNMPLAAEQVFVLS